MSLWSKVKSLKLYAWGKSWELEYSSVAMLQPAQNHTAKLSPQPQLLLA